MLRIVISFLFLVMFGFVNGQNLIQLGQRIKYGNQSLKFQNRPATESLEDLFEVDINFQSIATETVLKLSGLKLKEEFKYKFGYSLELSYMFSSEVLKTTYSSGPNPSESYPIGKIQTVNKSIRQISITNSIEFHYKISDKFLFTNSLGVSLASKDVYKRDGSSVPLYNESKYQTPIALKISYSPQLILSFNKFSLNFHLIQDMLRLNSIFNKQNPKVYGYASNAHLSTYTGFGIFFIPHFSVKIDEKELLKDDFDY